MLMLEWAILLPLLAGVLTIFLPIRWGRALLPVTAGGHFLLTILAWAKVSTPALTLYFSPDPAGLLVLLVTSFIFCFIACYAVSYMAETHMASEPYFLACTLFFLASMSMVALADHLVVLWIAIEATTLMSAPLIFLHRSKEALEATWKYVMICSVGIALALLGSFFIIMALDSGQGQVPITFSALIKAAPQLEPIWLKAGFVFLLIGYGTKMGLAPMHTWLPDAHSEAPSPASALLSGALLNCAFLGVYRSHQLLYAAGLGDFSSNILIGFGLLSMLIAAIFIFNQQGYKRLLAYSSIENMGIIAFGVGLGGLATYGAMLHIVHHSLLKASLFLSSGNVLLGYGSKLVHKTGNMARLFPKTFTAFFAGFLGISGLPPFGIFVSELLIIMGGFAQGRIIATTIFILLLALVFAGAARQVLTMSFAPYDQEILVGERSARLWPIYALLATSALLTVWLPTPIYQAIITTIATVGGGLHG